MAIAQFAQSLLADLRYALRRLRNAPGYAFTSILMLGLGLGATAAMLAVVDSVLLRPVALPHPEQLIAVNRLDKTGTPQSLRLRDVEALRSGASGFAGVASYVTIPKPVVTRDATRVIGVWDVSTNFFQLLGVHAKLGRTFTSADRTAPVAVVSDAFWRDNLHADPHVVGSAIKVEGHAVTIIGIMPPGFAFPPESTSGPVVSLPLVVDAKGHDQNGFDGTSVLARLRSVASRPAALAQAQAVYGRTGADAKDKSRLHFETYSHSLTGDEQPALLALLAACALLLGIACVNSANLQIARGTVQAAEMRVRAALGASRSRLLQQIAVESITVSLLGAALGIAIANGAVHWARAAYGAQFARFNELAVHPLVLAGCAALAMLVGLLAALAPAITAMRNAADSLNVQATRTVSRARLSNVLVATEVALTCVLLATTGLFLRTFNALAHVPLGFHPQHVTEITLMPTNPLADGQVFKQTYANLLAKLSTLPGVQAATTATSFPFAPFQLSFDNSVRILGLPQRDSTPAGMSLIDTGFIRTLGVTMLQGRALEVQDESTKDRVCLVNQAFVRKFLSGTDAVGKSVQIASDTTDSFAKAPIRIVGVMPDQVTGQSIHLAKPMMYFDYQLIPPGDGVARFLFGIAPQFAVRSTLSQDALNREIRAVLRQTAPNMAEMGIQSMEDGMKGALNNQRLALRLASGFGFIALVLSAIGIYGVLAYTVAQRTRELGIRMALGSTRAGAVKLVARQAGVMAMVGLAAGMGAAWPAGRAVRSFLFGVKPLDPLSLSATAVLLLAVCAAAAAAPAWRATQVDPAEALRAE